MTILTQHAYRGNGKELWIILQQITLLKSVTSFGQTHIQISNGGLHPGYTLVIWSSLQLTSKLWIITQQFTARADLYLKQSPYSESGALQ